MQNVAPGDCKKTLEFLLRLHESETQKQSQSQSKFLEILKKRNVEY